MTISSVDAPKAPKTHNPDPDDAAPVAPTRSEAPKPSVPLSSRAPSFEESRAVGSKIDSDLVAFVTANANAEAKAKNGSKATRAGAAALPTSSSAPRSEAVLYVGMNDDSTHAEQQALRANGANVTALLRRDATTVTLGGGVTFDLASNDGCASFTKALGAKYDLMPPAMKKIEGTLTMSPPSARDELARFAMAIAPGEKGAAIPSRIVLSGHSLGRDVHHKDESFPFESALSIAQAMPTASKQIEDVHFSGCFTAAQIYEAPTWQATFPNLKTMWGYAGIAGSGLPTHMTTWEQRTRGRTESDPARKIASNVVTWSVKDGIKNGVSLASLRADQKEADSRFGMLWSGEMSTTSPIIGAATGDYQVYRELQYRPELSKQEQTIMQAKADVLLRARFYHSAIRTEIQAKYGDQIKSAYESVGLPVPDFAHLSRVQALSAIKKLEDRTSTLATSRPGGIPRAAQDALPLLKSIARLEPTAIPKEWCH